MSTAAAAALTLLRRMNSAQTTTVLAIALHKISMTSVNYFGNKSLEIKSEICPFNWFTSNKNVFIVVKFCFITLLIKKSYLLF